MTIKDINGIRTLYHRNNPVQSVTIEEALGDFLTFIKQGKNSDEVNNNLTVLIGHNSATFLFSFETVARTSRVALLT